MDACVFVSHVSVVHRLDWVRLAVRVPDPAVAVVVAGNQTFRTPSEDRPTVFDLSQQSTI